MDGTTLVRSFYHHSMRRFGNSDYGKDALLSVRRNFDGTYDMGIQYGDGTEYEEKGVSQQQILREINTYNWKMYKPRNN